MLDKETLVKVKNTTRGRVGYIIPDLDNLDRNFMPGEIKEVTFNELNKLMFTPGGEALLRNHLTIQNPEALKEILGDVEPEYFYTQEDVQKLLITGSIEQFMDFLDFAPQGLINLAQDLAVSMEISDIRKREAIQNKTGFNVTKAIEINHETGVDEEINNEQKIRRAAPINQEESQGKQERRTNPPKYKVTTTLK